MILPSRFVSSRLPLLLAAALGFLIAVANAQSLAPTVYSFDTPTTGPRALIRTSILTGNPAVPDAEFRILVAVVENPTGQIPAACTLAVSYPLDSVQYIGAREADMGGPSVGSEIITSNTATRRVLAAGGAELNTEPTAGCFILRFKTLASPRYPFDIVIADVPPPHIPLVADDLQTAIPHLIDYYPTTHLPNPPTPTPSLTPSPTPSPSPSLTPTPTQTPTPSLTPSPSPTPTETPTPSATASPTPPPTPTPTATPPPSPTPDFTPTPTAPPTPSPLPDGLMIL